MNNILSDSLKLVLIFAILLSVNSLLKGQTLITMETFDEGNGSLSGFMTNGEPWVASGNNCDALGFFGVNGGAFVCEDYEGFTCCDCVGSTPNPAGTCGDASNTIDFGPIDISNYLGIVIEVDVNQIGDLECVVGGNPNAPCPGSPIEGCNGGSDQMIFSYSLDGGPYVVFEYYCGDNALCYANGFGCITAGTQLDIRVTLGTQGMGEAYIINEISVYGYEASDINIDVIGNLCVGESISLVENGGSATSWMWSGPGGTNSSSTWNLNNLQISNSGTYQVVITDNNGCTASNEVTINVTTEQDPSFSLADFCAPTSGAPTGIATPGGTFSFDPDPGDGASIDMSTGILTNAVGGTTYSVKYVTPGPCPGEQIFNVMANSGPSGTLAGNATLCPGECATFSFTFTSGNEPFTINLTANPPGLPLPPIPGVSASQVFTICYQGSGPFPTFDPSTFTINIPTIFTGSGSLNLTGISDGSGCPGSASGSFSLTLTQGPNASQAAPMMACADMNGNGLFDLTTLNNTVNGGNGGLTVNWYEDMTATIPITNPSAYLSSGGTVYATVTNGTCESNPVAIILLVNTSNVPFISMVCAESGTDDCSICLTGGTALLEFSFSDGNTYIVTVRDNSSLAQYSGNVNNTTGLNVPITISTTFELLSIQPLSGCPNFSSYGDLVTITIVSPPALDPIPITPSCQPISLPPITGNNLSGNQGYFTGPNGSGTMYNAGDLIFTTQTLYIFDTNAGCEDEEVVTIMIMPLVTINEIDDISDCLSAVLPPIMGTGLSSSVSYNTHPLGTGISYAPGSTVSESLTLYVVDPLVDPGCEGNSVDVNVTINPLPPTPAISNVMCTGSVGAFSVTSPIGVNYEYILDTNPGQFSTNFENIANGTHVIKVVDTITSCENSFTFSVNCNCATPALLSLSQSSESICIGDTLRVSNNSFGGAANIVNITSNGQGNLDNTSYSVSPFSFNYVPAIQDIGKVITITLSTNDPDGGGPCAPETINFQLTVRNKPDGEISGPTQVCLGGNVILMASGGVSYSWSDGGGNASQATFNNLIQRDTFTVILTDAFGCKDTVSQDVSVGLISAGRDTIVGFCNVMTSNINLNTLLSAGVPTTGIWKKGQDTIFNFSNYPVTSLPLGITDLRYILDDPLCGIDTALININIISNNNAGIDGQRSYCEGFSGIIPVSNIIGAYDPSGIWNISPTSDKIRIIDSNIDVNAPEPGKYLLSYIIPFNGCDADTSFVTIDIINKPDAGKDTTIFTCIGTDLDLTTLIRSNDLSGTIENFNNYSGFIDRMWNTAGFSEGIYTFKYNLPSQSSVCNGDTALIAINLEAALSAGESVIDKFCEGETLNLNNYLSTGADPGGSFFYQNQLVTNGIFIPSNNESNFVFSYELGDDINCPKSIAFITLTKESKPAFLWGNANDICDGQCVVINTSQNSDLGSTMYFTIKNATGSFSQEKITTQTSNNTSDFTFCARKDPPFSFNSLPIGQDFTLYVDSIHTPTGCKFSYSGQVNFATKALPTKTISPLLCKDEVFTISGEVFSFTRPTGTVIVPSMIATNCDTLVNISLSFYPDPVGRFEDTYCDESASITIGNETFNFQRPDGTATIKGASVNGCDSLVQVSLKWEKTVFPGTYTFSTCNDSYSYILGGETFDKTRPRGTVLLSGAAAQGCDSLVNVQLDFSTFSIVKSTNYLCDGSDPQLILSLASHPGPYTVSIDGNVVSQNESLPFTYPISVGTHTVVVTNSDGCAETFPVNVEDRMGPVVELSQSPNSDGSVQIITTAPANSIYNLVWSPSNTLTCNDCLNPIANPTETTVYTLNYLYGNECPDQRQITVERLNTEVVLPNIFTPNGDGLNDVFYVQFPEKVSGIVKSMKVYDRWGNKIFMVSNKPGNSPADGWNGYFGSQAATVGVYVYIIEVQIDGKATVDTYHGQITLMR